MRQLMLKKIKGLPVTWFSPGSPDFSTNKTAKIQIINYVDNLNMLEMQHR
jgi:hypothetical protein